MDVASGDLPELQEAEIGPRAGPDDALLETADAAFGLGGIQAARDLGGTYNLNLRLYTAGGSFVLRVHRPWVTAERVAVLQSAKQRLAAAGFPVSVPLATTEGKSALRWGNRLVEVEPFVAHDTVADSWDRYPPAFAALARLHDALAAAVDPQTFVPPRVSNYGSPIGLLGWVGQTEARIRPIRPVTRRHARCRSARPVTRCSANWPIGGPARPPACPCSPSTAIMGAATSCSGGATWLRWWTSTSWRCGSGSMTWPIVSTGCLVRLAGTELPADVPWEATRGMLDAYDAAPGTG